MSINKDTVIRALEGVLLFQYPVLWETSGQPTEEHTLAIRTVQENLNDFRQFVLEELLNYPNTHKYFGQLIRKRLFQERPLASRVIQSLFPNGPIELENRLGRILHIPNIEASSLDARVPKASDKGDETDEIILDVWAEFFVVDFLTRVLEIDYFEKVVRDKAQPCVDYYAKKDHEEWIVEVARLRIRDFQGDTMLWGSKNCTEPKNVSEIQKALHSKFSDKNKQIQKFIRSERRDFDKRIVVIKTSQEEYQDCKQVIVTESKRLLKERSYPELTHILLIYDTETYEFVENLQAS